MKTVILGILGGAVLCATQGWSKASSPKAAQGKTFYAQHKKVKDNKNSQVVVAAPTKEGKAFFTPSAEAATPANKVAEQDMGQQLIAWGKKYEASSQLQNALWCYQAALPMVPEEAQRSIDEVHAKMKKVAEQKQRAEEINALLRGVNEGHAEDAYKLGKIYWAEGDVPSAEKMWMKATEMKHAEAAYRLAKMYDEGDHVAVNITEAEKYYRKGADLGHPECMYVTAKLLEMAAQNGDPTDDKMGLAKRYKEDAANQGHTLAAIEVGFTYSQANDHSRAKYYFELAAKNATPTDTIKLMVRQLMSYCIAAESLQSTYEGLSHVGPR